MKCPGCGLYHPPLYERCVSCGANLGAVSSEAAHKGNGRDEEEAPAAVQTLPPPPTEEESKFLPERRHRQKRQRYSGLPTAAGIALVVVIMLVSAGATMFFLTKPHDDERLYQKGLKELSGGQYAFAVKSLEKASTLQPSDPRIFLALARAYVGVDQVDKAWAAISQAQQLGSGVVSDPTLTSELANYYRQKQQYERAIDLLRPLAGQNIPGKKAELADLEALWGDEALSKGNYDRALKNWEEVRDLKEGTRYTEAETRLSTIYQKLVDKLVQQGNDSQALAYLAKLSTIAQNPTYYERSAEIYERQGKLELAIDQYRKSARLAGANSNVNERLAGVMSKRGKELLDAGDTAAGYGYLQEARALDPQHITVPPIAVRNILITIEPSSSHPTLNGDVWNPGPEPIKELNLKVQLIDTTSRRVIWEQTRRVIDEFEPPLEPQLSKPFTIEVPTAVKQNGSTALSVFLDNSLYKTYPIGVKTGKDNVPTGATRVNKEPPSAPSIVRQEKTPETAPPIENQAQPPSEPSAPTAAPTPAPTQTPPPTQTTPEDQTIRDLDQ